MRLNKARDRLKRRLTWLGLLNICILMLPGATPSKPRQQSAAGEDRKDVIGCRLGSDLVIVEVEVKDGNGSALSNLRHDQFRVYEDGKRQPVSFFTEKTESELDESPIKYRLGYYPTAAPTADWVFRRIRVKVRNSKALGMSASCDPQGYFSGPRD